MSVTREDVANKVGVSTTTVSNVINGTKYVTPELKSKVKQAIRELGYRPNITARSLITKRSKQVAILIDDITNPFFDEIILGFEGEAKKRGYMANIGIGNNSTSEYFNDFLSRNIDGVFIMMNIESRISSEKIKELSRNGTVVVNTIENNPYKEYSSNIYANNLEAMKKIFEHLIDLGHEKIGFIDFTEPKLKCNLGRYNGYKKCLDMYKLDYNEDYVIFGEPPYGSSYEEGYKYMNKLISRNTDITAAIIINDYMATGALAALKDADIKVPEDISIVSFDNTMLSKITTPKLTSLHVDNKLNGIKAMQLIDKMINGDIGYISVEVPTNLVIRDSTSHV